MGVVLTIVSFLVILFVLMASHEMGHFIASKRAGVIVEEFGIGFPPRLFAFKRGETSYSINLIPLGAFVKTPGESDPDVPGSLASKSPWCRMGVYAAGPLTNVFLAFVILGAFFMLPTDVIRGGGVMVHSVSVDSPAEREGVRAGDIILEIGQQQIDEWQDVQDAVNSNEGEEKTLLLQRDGEEIEISLTPELDPDSDRYVIGILLCWGMVTGVEAGSLAEEADMRPGDTVLSIGGEAVYSDQTMAEAAGSVEVGEEASVLLLRDGEEVDVIETSLEIPEDGLAAIGLSQQWVSDTHIESQRVPFWQALYRGGDYVVHIPYLIKESIPLIKEDPSKAIVGVVGAGQLTVEAVKYSGFSNVLLLGGIISVGLALFNFIPIPPLDGGGMLIAFIEGVRRGKRLSPKTVRYAYAAGTALMLTLFVVIMYSDIARLIRYITTGEGFTL